MCTITSRIVILLYVDTQTNDINSYTFITTNVNILASDVKHFSYTFFFPQEPLD